MKEKVIYLQGIKLDKNPIAKLLLPAYKRIKVWPPSLPANSKRAMLKRTAMLRESLTFSKRALNEDHNLAIYAEGGRSYHAKLKKGEAAIAHYLQINPNAIIVPVSISGTEKIMPPGSFLIFSRPATVSFGEPIEVKFLNEKFKDLPNNERREKIVDYIMHKIAERLPEKYRGVYSNRE